MRSCLLYTSSNLTSTRFLVFGVKGLNEVAANVRSTILLTLLSYMTDKLLIEGNTVAALDELYIWLGNPVAVEYIRKMCIRDRFWTASEKMPSGAKPIPAIRSISPTSSATRKQRCRSTPVSYTHLWSVTSSVRINTLPLMSLS